MKKILITGASGMLGSALIEKYKDIYKLYLTSKSQPLNFVGNFLKFDFCKDDFRLLSDWVNPEIIIHCAAITDVDYCESNKEIADTVNTESVKNLVKNFPESKIVFISTDAIFTEPDFAKEDTIYNPVNYYGFTKMQGEKILLESFSNSVIIRTTIIGYNRVKPGFIDWIINSLKQNKEIGLFSDSIFNPISIWDLADCIKWCIENDCPKILNINGTEAISKYDFGLKLAEKFKLNKSLIKKIKIADVDFCAQRNRNMTLCTNLYTLTAKKSLPKIKTTINNLYEHNYKGNEKH